MQKSKQDQKNSSQLKRRPGIKRFSACVDNYSFHLPQGQIYQILETNLLNDNCPTAALYFGKLVAKEDELVKTFFRFKKRVRDSQCLLLTIVENIKSAEDAYRTIDDQKLALRLLIQTVHMIHAQDESFNWLVKEVYKIIFKISKEWVEECSEMLSRAHFEYGIVLAEEDDCLEEAITFMEKSLEVCKGTTWYTNEMDRNFLYEDVCTKLCETLLRIAAISSKTNPKISASFAQRAANAIRGMGTRDSPNLYCIASLRQSEYLISNQDYEKAFQVLKNIEKDIMSNHAPRNMCEFYLWLGICQFNLNPQNINLALRKFKLSLDLSDMNSFADLKAKTLLFLGKIHSQKSTCYAEARQCFIEAKDIFQKLRDFENEKLAKFLMAQLKAYQIFPNYLELIKRASTNKFCYMFDLIQWKQRVLPFWNENGELKQHEDDIQCLLQENLER